MLGPFPLVSTAGLGFAFIGFSVTVERFSVTVERLVSRFLEFTFTMETVFCLEYRFPVIEAVLFEGFVVRESFISIKRFAVFREFTVATLCRLTVVMPEFFSLFFQSSSDICFIFPWTALFFGFLIGEFAQRTAFGTGRESYLPSNNTYSRNEHSEASVEKRYLDGWF